MRTLRIEDVVINDDSDCYVIAEIGGNHQGNLETAKDMFRIAKECGADAVKLQKRDNKALLTRQAYDRPYDNENSWGATYGQHREYLEFGEEHYRELQRHARVLGITFFATPFDIPSADFVANLEMPAFKTPSCDLKNIPLIEHVASFQKPMLISTGGGNMADVEHAVEAATRINPQVAVLQCTTAYPTKYEELNLSVIRTYRERFADHVIGLSSHDTGIAMAVAGYVLGARIVEKHFTLNRTWKGTDHSSSLEPQGLEKMIRDLRRTRIALGDGVKKVYPSEIAPLEKLAKSLVAVRALKAGTVLTAADIAAKCPGGGLSPKEFGRVIGRTLAKDLGEDQQITLDVVVP